MKKRDYLTEDFTYVYEPNFKDLFPIDGPDSIDCDCCEESCQLKGDDYVKVFRWHPYTPFYDYCKPKLIYCQDCLEHFGALECPFIRGVPCYKKCKPEILAKIKAL